MRTQYFTSTSLDGFIATLDDSLDWLFQLGDADETSYPSFIANIGAIAMGSSTYEWMLRHLTPSTDLTTAAHVPKGASASDQEPRALAWPYTQPTWVFSSRKLPAVSGADIRFVQGDIRPVHEQMLQAAGGNNIWLVGGGELVGQFHDAGLLDDVFVQIGSVTLGSGKPLLPREIAFPPLRLISVRQLGTVFAELHYEVAKPLLVDLQPVLHGSLITVRPMRESDWATLFAVASDPLIWEQHPQRDRYEEQIFREFFRGAMDSKSAFVVIDNHSGSIIGSSRYTGYDEQLREIEIGWTFLARSHWGGRFNNELKQLMLDHAFRFVDRVIFTIGEENIRSRRAVERIGATLLESHPSAKAGRVVYGITRS